MEGPDIRPETAEEKALEDLARASAHGYANGRLDGYRGAIREVSMLLWMALLLSVVLVALRREIAR